MKPKKPSLLQRLLNRYYQWRSDKQFKILNTMTAHSFDEALRIANRKRDIINNKVWVISGAGIFLIFARYQMKNLQVNKLLNKHLTGKELDEKASYIAYPVTENDRKRGGKIRRFVGPSGAPTRISRTGVEVVR